MLLGRELRLVMHRRAYYDIPMRDYPLCTLVPVQRTTLVLVDILGRFRGNGQEPGGARPCPVLPQGAHLR
jgi:hypothetical protein